MPRIIAGQFRGRLLEAPSGEGTRPTSDRVRESLASSVLSQIGCRLEDACVLDAFAGTGAFGLEMLSRGVRHCSFFEAEPQAYKVLMRNIEACKVERGRFAASGADVFQAASQGAVAGSFDVVFLDPPYAVTAEKAASLVKALDEGGCLNALSLVIYEHATTEQERRNLPALKRHRDVAPTEAEIAFSPFCEAVCTKNFGKTSVTIMKTPSKPSHPAGREEQW